MSIEYYGACHDCQKYIDLDKFGDWASYDIELNSSDPTNEDLDYYKTYNFVHKCLRLHFFMQKHPGHRIEVLNWDTFYDSGKWDLYKEVYYWPNTGKTL